MAYTVKRLEEFSDWLKGLKDGRTRLRLIKRLRKVQLGNLGDVEPVGEGVYEMREHFGRAGACTTSKEVAFES